ncbi:hypothetical protein ACFSR6_08755 [Pedobacter vanadiisoli]|uniref:Uncharacterized protein n=1 Tax=Pedobacter vanadiisoli TaxID=1761975 RepID=A0ABW5MH92_9SPHI
MKQTTINFSAKLPPSPWRSGILQAGRHPDFFGKAYKRSKGINIVTRPAPALQKINNKTTLNISSLFSLSPLDFSLAAQKPFAFPSVTYR